MFMVRLNITSGLLREFKNVQNLHILLCIFIISIVLDWFLGILINTFLLFPDGERYGGSIVL